MFGAFPVELKHGQGVVHRKYQLLLAENLRSYVLILLYVKSSGKQLKVLG